MSGLFGKIHNKTCCCGDSGNTCCEGIEMPTTLYCTIDVVGASPGGGCSCLPKTITMTFNGSSMNPAWVGSLDNVPGNGSWCDNLPPGNDFKVRFFCDGVSWNLHYGSGGTTINGSTEYIPAPCAADVASPEEFTCSPVYVRFEQDGSCCGPTGAGPQTLIITVTE